MKEDLVLWNKVSGASLNTDLHYVCFLIFLLVKNLSLQNKLFGGHVINFPFFLFCF